MKNCEKMTLFIYFVIFFFLSSFTTSIYKRYANISSLKKAIKEYKNYISNFKQNNKIPADFNEYNDYDEEPGNDWTYDEHGNVIYGKGFVGAPRRPASHIALTCNQFLRKYMVFDKKTRLAILTRKKQKTFNEPLEKLIYLLYKHETSKTLFHLENDLRQYAKTYVPVCSTNDVCPANFFC